MDKDTSETVVPRNYDSRNIKEPRGQRYLIDNGPKELPRQQEQHRTPWTKIPRKQWPQRTIEIKRNSTEPRGQRYPGDGGYQRTIETAGTAQNPVDKNISETMAPKNYRDSRNSKEPQWTKISQRRWPQRTIETAGTAQNPVDKDTSETMVPKNYRDSSNSTEPRGQRYLRDDGPKELLRQQEQQRTPWTKIPQRRWSQRTIETAGTVKNTTGTVHRRRVQQVPKNCPT